MPLLRPPRPHRPSRPRRPGAAHGVAGPARIVVLGDLVLDVVLAPAVPLDIGTDVPGRVRLLQGGSAATTARWVGRLGARASLVCAVGRDGAGRALVDAVRSDKVVVRVVRVAGVATGRIGVLVAADGERSFVADRGAADRLTPDDLEASWFAGSEVLHLPAYSLLGEPLGRAGMRAVQLARGAGALVSVDLASTGPLLADGRRAALALIRAVAPDLLFATQSESEALLGRSAVEGLLDLAPAAVVKRGAKGATVLARDGDTRLRFEVATQHLTVTDTTGAGDAFDAGFLVGWIAARHAGSSLPASLQRAAVAGHRAATRQLGSARPELSLG